MTKPRVKHRTLLVIGAFVALLSSGGKSFAQDAAPSDESIPQFGIVLQANAIDSPSPELRNPQVQELAERLQLALENSFKGAQSKVEAAVFAVSAVAQERSEGPQHEGHPRAGISFTGPPTVGPPPGPPNFGPPNFGPPGFGPPGFGPPDFNPPGLRMRGRVELHQGQSPQIHHPEPHGPEGAFEEDRRRIQALTESAQRLAQAGLPDLAHGLRERAEQIERELAEKQERMQQEERQRAEAKMRERQAQARHQPQRLMEQRREGIEHGDHPPLPLRTA